MSEWSDEHCLAVLGCGGNSLDAAEYARWIQDNVLGLQILLRTVRPGYEPGVILISTVQKKPGRLRSNDPA